MKHEMGWNLKPSIRPWIHIYIYIIYCTTMLKCSHGYVCVYICVYIFIHCINHSGPSWGCSIGCFFICPGLTFLGCISKLATIKKQIRQVGSSWWPVRRHQAQSCAGLGTQWNPCTLWRGGTSPVNRNIICLDASAPTCYNLLGFECENKICHSCSICPLVINMVFSIFSHWNLHL